MDRQTKYRRTPSGVVTMNYSSQVRNSQRRGHPRPNYTVQELQEWALSQPIFMEIYNKWVDSNYDRWSRPSFDRLDNSKPYSFDNIQIMTSYDNLKKEKLNPKPVLRSDGVEFKSILEAEREGGYPEGKSKISLVCRGIRKSYKGYGWKFINKEDCPYELDTN